MRQPMWFVVVLAILATAQIGVPAPGNAQGIAPPPRHDAQSPQGVSYRTGSFSYSEPDLSIGGDAQGGLKLERNYNSSSNLPPDIYTATVGWTHNLLGFISNQLIPQNPDDVPLPLNRRPWIYQVSIGSKSYGFLGGSTYPPSTGGPVGAYRPASPSGASLVFNGTTSAGYYTFTDSDGSVINFTAGSGARIADWTFPDGTRLDFTYTPNKVLRAVISTRGYAILFESATKICVVSMAQTYVTATSSCPVDAQTVTYGYTASTYNSGTMLLTSAIKNGSTTTYGYGPADHLSCVTFPAQATCGIQNQFGVVCPPDPDNPNFQPWVRLNDPVTQQTDAAGRIFTYNYSVNRCTQFGTDPDYRPFQSSTTSYTVNGIQTTAIVVNTAALPTNITDPLTRATALGYYSSSDLPIEQVLPATVTLPEGNGSTITYDARGNIISLTQTAKPGSGLANTMTTAGYPATCANRKTCNRPDYVTDANGNRTDYTYDPNSGGVATETGPAVNGIRPQKRYTYTQRYAWVKNSSGSYVAMPTPVWVRTGEAYCMTTAYLSGACTGGATDEVVITYGYGPEAGPNNLLMRAKVITWNGTALRTCYRYDANGNKINEVTPNAGLTSCS